MDNMCGSSAIYSIYCICSFVGISKVVCKWIKLAYFISLGGELAANNRESIWWGADFALPAGAIVNGLPHSTNYAKYKAMMSGNSTKCLYIKIEFVAFANSSLAAN